MINDKYVFICILLILVERNCCGICKVLCFFLMFSLELDCIFLEEIILLRVFLFRNLEVEFNIIVIYVLFLKNVVVLFYCLCIKELDGNLI